MELTFAGGASPSGLNVGSGSGTAVQVAHQVGPPCLQQWNSSVRCSFGSAFSVCNDNFIDAPWDELEGIAQDLIASDGVPAEYLGAATG